MLWFFLLSGSGHNREVLQCFVAGSIVFRKIGTLVSSHGQLTEASAGYVQADELRILQSGLTKSVHRKVRFSSS